MIFAVSGIPITVHQDRPFTKAQFLYFSTKHDHMVKYMGIGIGLGAGIGVALGVAFHNIGLGIAIGISIGAGMGVALGSAFKRGEEKEEDPDN